MPDTNGVPRLTRCLRAWRSARRAWRTVGHNDDACDAAQRISSKHRARLARRWAVP